MRWFTWILQLESTCSCIFFILYYILVVLGWNRNAWTSERETIFINKRERWEVIRHRNMRYAKWRKCNECCSAINTIQFPGTCDLYTVYNNLPMLSRFKHFFFIPSCQIARSWLPMRWSTWGRKRFFPLWYFRIHDLECVNRRVRDISHIYGE
jgi:hypothetical protein